MACTSLTIASYSSHVLAFGLAVEPGENFDVPVRVSRGQHSYNRLYSLSKRLSISLMTTLSLRAWQSFCLASDSCCFLDFFPMIILYVSLYARGLVTPKLIMSSIMVDHKIAIEVDASKREELKDFLCKYWPDTIEVL